MIDPKNEILFCEYCKTCKHKLCNCEDEPCCDCLATPVNYYSHKPVLWEGVDTLFNKPVERRNHEVERAVREAVYLNAKDTAEAIDKQGTIAGKVHMRDLISCAVHCIGEGCNPSPTYTYGEMENLITMILTGIFKSDAKVITHDMLKGYTGYRGFDIPNAEEIGEFAFHRNAMLKFDTLPITVKKIGDYAFCECTSLLNQPYGLQNVEYIGKYAFHNSSVNSEPISRDYRNSLDLDKLTYLGEDAFFNCYGLFKVSANILDQIGDYAFYNCVNLQSVEFDNATAIGYAAFGACISLDDASFNSVEYISSNAFAGCRNLEHIMLKKVNTIPQNAFSGCFNLYDIAIPNAQRILSSAFSDCYNLSTIYLNDVTSVTELASDALPEPKDLLFWNDFGIFVPGDLYYSFKYSSDWATYSQKILPIGDPNKIKNIDLSCTRGGSIENSFGKAYSDEPVLTRWWVASSAHPVNVKHTISPDDGYDILSVYDNDVECTNAITKVIRNGTRYTVNSVNGALYGFTLDSSGWYVSQNKGKSNSAAICRINFNLPYDMPISLSYINYAENGCDYGIIGKIDRALGLNSSASDSSNYYWLGNRSSDSTPSTITTTIFVPAGEHFIDIKFRKDGSVDKFNDSFKFKINTANENWTKIEYTYNLENLNENHDIYVQFVKKSSEDTNIIIDQLYTDNDINNKKNSDKEMEVST